MTTNAHVSDQELLPATTSVVLVDAELVEDRKFVELWLHGKSRHSQRNYRRHVDQFLAFVAKPLHSVSLSDVQAFSLHLDTLPLCDGSKHAMLSSVKSLFTFLARLGYLQFDTAKPLRLPAGKDTLNERILEEAEVDQLIEKEPLPRNAIMLELLYNAGLRCSEVAGLKWGDAQAHRGAGQLTIFGKGSKTRVIRLESEMWNALLSMRGDAGNDDPVFKSRNGGGLSESQVLRIVKAAARRAGISKPVTTHWLRHCHASHALDNGSPIHLLQASLGHSSIATTSRYLHARPSESSSKFIKPRSMRRA